MFDYRDRITKLITTLYTDGDILDHDVRMTTSNVVKDLQTIVPPTAVDEFLVNDILEELGFTPKYERKEEVVLRTIEGQFNDDGSPVKEKDIELYDDMAYYWYFKKKQS